MAKMRVDKLVEGKQVWHSHGVEDIEGFPTDGFAKSPQTDLHINFNTNKDGIYKEFTTSGGSLSKIDMWEDSSKATKLFTKTFTYVSGVLSEIETVDEINSKTLTKALVYTSGILSNITEVIT